MRHVAVEESGGEELGGHADSVREKGRGAFHVGCQLEPVTGRGEGGRGGRMSQRVRIGGSVEGGRSVCTDLSVSVWMSACSQGELLGTHAITCSHLRVCMQVVRVYGYRYERMPAYMYGRMFV